MPLYEYECARAGVRFEEIQKFSDPPLTRCPECDKHPECQGEAKKLLSAPAIQFKGSGWYVTDYARAGDKSKKEGKDGDSKPADKTEKAEKKTETKKESKSESKGSTSDKK